MDVADDETHEGDVAMTIVYGIHVPTLNEGFARV